MLLLTSSAVLLGGSFPALGESVTDPARSEGDCSSAILINTLKDKLDHFGVAAPRDRIVQELSRISVDIIEQIDLSSACKLQVRFSVPFGSIWGKRVREQIIFTAEFMGKGVCLNHWDGYFTPRDAELLSIFPSTWVNTGSEISPRERRFRSVCFDADGQIVGYGK